MFKRQLVLVAINHATDLERTMAVALRTAKARGADVHILHVVPHRPMHIDDRVGPWAFDPHDNFGGGSGTALASLPRSADHDGVRVRRVTLRGVPEHAISAYAQLHDAIVLVVERDYGSSRFWRTGRTVDEVVRQSSIPLLVLPRRQTSERHESGPRRVLTPVDFSIASAIALRTSVELARHHGARVTLLHTLKDVPGHMVFSGSEAWEVVRRLRAQKHAAAERLRRTAAFFGAADFDTAVTTGIADGAILEIARRSNADLIVMGTTHRSWFDRVLSGSTLRRVLHRATVPVLVIPVMAGAHTWPTETVVDPVNSRGSTEPAADRVAA